MKRPLQPLPVPEALRVTVAEASGLKRSIADVRPTADQREIRLAVRPGTRYVWQIAPITKAAESQAGRPRLVLHR